MPADPIEIEVKLEPEDIVSLSLHTTYASPYLARRRRILSAVLLSGMAAALLVSVLLRNGFVAAFIGVMSAFLVYRRTGTALRRRYSRLLRKLIDEAKNEGR